MFEIVPNISEGRDPTLIDDLVYAVEKAGARVLHRTSDEVHHRSVLTIAGEAAEVVDAALAIAGIAVERIDLRTHRGVHPRIGALDVLPFVPLGEESLERAIELAHTAAQRIWDRYRVPSFFYGAAARIPQRTLLADVRKGEFESLDIRFSTPDWKPDVGTIAKHASAGAIAIGARPILIAFNVNLATGDVRVARTIAATIREKTGGLRTLRALGFSLSEREVQVSLNLTSYRDTPLYRVVEIIRALAAAQNVEISRSELIGCLPLEAVEATARYYLGLAKEG